MCDPISITQAAVSIGGALASYSSQSQTASRQAAAIQRNNDLQQADLVRQRQQQAEQGAQEANDYNRQAMKDRATFDTLTGEFGGGNSADRARSVSGVQEGEHMGVISENVQRGESETGFQSLATTSQANGRLASISQPSFWGTALTIGTSAFKTIDNADKLYSLDPVRRAKGGDPLFPWNDEIKSNKKMPPLWTF